MLRNSLFLSIALLLCSAATATNYYVAANGSNGNPGTKAQPFQSLNTGVQVLTPGDTLYVRAGTYNVNLLFNIPSGTDWAHPVVLAAYPGESVTLRGPSNGRIVEMDETHHHIIIEGFHLDANQYEWAGVKIYNSNHIRFCNNEMFNSSGNFFTGGGEYLQFIGNDIHHNGSIDPNYPQGTNTIYLSGSNNLMDGNRCHDNIGSGLCFWTSADVYSHGNVARNNIVWNNRAHLDGYADGGVGIFFGGQYKPMDACSAYNNIIVDNVCGIRAGFYFSGSDIFIANNTVINNGPQGGIGFDAISGTIQNNLVLGNDNSYGDGNGQAPNDIWIRGNAAVTIDHNLTSTAYRGCTVIPDAKFLNAAARDFHLLSTSPAINAGTNLSAIFTTDFEGNPRPQGGVFDVGAYEYTGGTTVTSSLAISEKSVAPGGTITVIVTGGSNNPNQWVGVYSSTAPDADWGNCENCWKYLNGTQMIPSSAVTTPVTLTFTAPTDPGTYNFRLFPSDAADNRLAISSNFTVAGTADISATPARSNWNLFVAQVANRPLLRAYFPTAGKYSLSVYDLGGKLQWSSSQQFATAGERSIGLAGVGKSLSNGLYLVSLKTPTGNTRIRVAILK